MKGQSPHRQLSDKEITLGRGSQSERWDLEMGQEKEIAQAILPNGIVDHEGKARAWDNWQGKETFLFLFLHFVKMEDNHGSLHCQSKENCIPFLVADNLRFRMTGTNLSQANTVTTTLWKHPGHKPWGQHLYFSLPLLPRKGGRTSLELDLCM